MQTNPSERFLTYHIDAVRNGSFDGLLDRVVYDTKTRTATLAYRNADGTFSKAQHLAGTWVDDPIMPRFDITSQAFDSDRNGIADIGTAAIVDMHPTFLLASSPDTLTNTIANAPLNAQYSTYKYATAMPYDAQRPDTDEDYEPYIMHWVSGGLMEFIYENVDANSDGIEDCISLEHDVWHEKRTIRIMLAPEELRGL